jgi:hypothetical protein
VGVKFGASGIGIQRTTSLPADNTKFSMTGWTILNTSRGGPGIPQTYCILADDLDNHYVGLQTQNVSGAGLTLIASGGSGAIDFSPSPATGRWFFFGVTCDGTNANGYWAYPSDTALISSGNLGTTTFNPTYMELGNDVEDEWCDCSHSWVKIWNRTLTAAQILTEKARGRVIDPTGLYLSSPLNGPGDIRDYSGNGRNWALVGAGPTQVAGAPIGLGDFGGF